MNEQMSKPVRLNGKKSTKKISEEELSSLCDWIHNHDEIRYLFFKDDNTNNMVSYPLDLDFEPLIDYERRLEFSINKWHKKNMSMRISVDLFLAIKACIDEKIAITRHNTILDKSLGSTLAKKEPVFMEFLIDEYFYSVMVRDEWKNINITRALNINPKNVDILETLNPEVGHVYHAKLKQEYKDKVKHECDLATLTLIFENTPVNDVTKNKFDPYAYVELGNFGDVPKDGISDFLDVVYTESKRFVHVITKERWDSITFTLYKEENQDCSYMLLDERSACLSIIDQHLVHIALLYSPEIYEFIPFTKEDFYNEK